MAVILAFALLALLQAAPDAAETARTTERVARWREALELDLASEILAEAKEAPADAASRALYALALHASGERERALALVVERAEPPLVLAAARIALDEDELQRAQRLLEGEQPAAQRVRFPDEPDCWLLLGRVHVRSGDLARAEPLLVEFVRRAPWSSETPGALHALVDCARARNDAAEAARRETDRAKSAAWHAVHIARRLQAREHPDDPLPRIGLAQLWLAAGEIPRARSFLDEALRLDARACRALALYAELELFAKRPAESRARADAAIACDATLAEAHLALARALRLLGDEPAAQRAHERYRALGGREPL